MSDLNAEHGPLPVIRGSNLHPQYANVFQLFGTALFRAFKRRGWRGIIFGTAEYTAIPLTIVLLIVAVLEVIRPEALNFSAIAKLFETDLSMVDWDAFFKTSETTL